MSNKLIPRQYRYDGNCFGNYGKWYVQVIDSWHYLHRDGVVRRGTCNNDQWSGFFATEAEALAAIEAYKAKHIEVKP